MVEYTHKSLSKLLKNLLRKDVAFNEALSVIKENSHGQIYLVGGTVSRTLVSELYGVSRQGHDFDFLVEKLNENLTSPSGWNVAYHKFGNPTFIKDGIEIDVFMLSDHSYIKRNKLKPTIENYLEGVPFSIQSVAYDIKNEKLIGNEGIKALRSRKIKVNNIESAKSVAKRKNMSINERMAKKAKSMGFEIVPYE